MVPELIVRRTQNQFFPIGAAARLSRTIHFNAETQPAKIVTGMSLNYLAYNR